MVGWLAGRGGESLTSTGGRWRDERGDGQRYGGSKDQRQLDLGESEDESKSWDFNGIDASDFLRTIGLAEVCEEKLVDELEVDVEHSLA